MSLSLWLWRVGVVFRFFFFEVPFLPHTTTANQGPRDGHYNTERDKDSTHRAGDTISRKPLLTLSHLPFSGAALDGPWVRITAPYRSRAAQRSLKYGRDWALAMGGHLRPPLDPHFPRLAAERALWVWPPLHVPVTLSAE